MSVAEKVEQLKGLYRKGVEMDKAGSLSDASRASMQEVFNVYGKLKEMGEDELQAYINKLSNL